MNLYVMSKNHKNFDSRDFLKKIFLQEFNEELNLNEIKFSINGKPFLTNKFYFNISHSKNYIGIVISKSEVGLDLEEKSRKLYKHFEKKFIGQEEVIINPLNNWVIKEAYSKFLGLGLRMNFKTVSAREILNKKFVYNLVEEELFCCVVGLEKLENVKYI